jgi:hypothetical protein
MNICGQQDSQLSCFETDNAENINVRIFPSKSFNEGNLKDVNMRLEYLTERTALIIWVWFKLLDPIVVVL